MNKDLKEVLGFRYLTESFLGIGYRWSNGPKVRLAGMSEKQGMSKGESKKDEVSELRAESRPGKNL